SQLNIKVQRQQDHYIVSGNAWVLPKQALLVGRGQSSQLISSLILNSPQLPDTLSICMQGERVSDDYFQMTLKICQDLGLSATWEKDELKISPWQKLSKEHYEVGADLSS